MTTPTLTPEDGLEGYGTPLAAYRGTGQLTLPKARLISCQFVACQFESGKIILLCVAPDQPFSLRLGLLDPEHFEGVTLDGFRVQVIGLARINDLSESSRDPWLVFRLNHLEVSQSQPSKRRHLIYTLTNLAGVQSAISFSIDSLSFELRAIDSAARNLRRLEVLRGVLPTAKIAISTAAPIEHVSQAVDEVCSLLSLALGTKVQWIALTEETKAHRWICTRHSAHITKRYGSLYTINPGAQEIGNFLRQVGSRSAARRKQVGLSQAVINTYLDAKAEGDFLQVRALKLVIAVEMLKAEYSAMSGMSSFILPEEDFDALAPKLKKALKASLPNTKPEERKALYSNAKCLNRTSFSDHLRQLCAEVRMPLPPGDLERFVESRNKLVHEGFFYCEKANERERKKLQPLPDVVSEWFWLLHFVDRLFLRAINYEGLYIHRSTSGAPVQGQLHPVD